MACRVRCISRFSSPRPGDVAEERELARQLIKDELPYDPFEDARAAGRDVLIYRRTATVSVDIKAHDLEERREQMLRMEEFFARFRNADGELERRERMESQFQAAGSRDRWKD